MSLSSLSLPISINTSSHSPVTDLFIPLLSQCKTFDVAVGYFSSGWLKNVYPGMKHFIRNGGASRWVVSPNLSPEDLDAIRQGMASRDYLDKSESALLENFSNLTSLEQIALAEMVANGVLEFKIAVPKKSNGMFHAKIGVARDEEGNQVAFSGSYNLTAAAENNWERIDVFLDDSHREKERIESISHEFEAIWNDQDSSYYVFSPSEKLITHIIERKKSVVTPRKPESIPLLRDYQEKAIKAWMSANGLGMYVMATGSGKTITALTTIDRMIQISNKKESSLFVLVVLPLKHLLDQWVEESEVFGLNPIKCYESSQVWSHELMARIAENRMVSSSVVVAMVTNATFATEKFQKIIKSINTNFLIVADEAHNLGSKTYLESLPENANYRLGLSATPERFNDPTGTKALMQYFGDPVIDFGLDDAINRGYLCPYDYVPHKCLLNEDEYEKFLKLVEIGKDILSNNGGDKSDPDYLKVLGERADLITNVESKIEILKDLMKQQVFEDGKVSHTLVYCGSRRGADGQRHIEKVVSEIGNIAAVRRFTASENLVERRQILDLFSNGELECIAAIKCLDEGVDVPATRVAYILASTANPREYIQRRGRVLRKSPGKSKALIHDFIAAPPVSVYDPSELLETELDRAYEFTELALNKTEALMKIEKIRGIQND